MPTPMSEKKWFIYVGDHHEGPFTVSEIWSGIDAGTYHQASFVWADGMKEWGPLVDIPEFQRAPAPTPEPIQPATLSPSEAETIPPIQEPSLVMDLHTATANGELISPVSASAPATEAVAPSPVSETVEVSVSEPAVEAPVAASPSPVEVETTKTGLTTFVEVKDLEDATRAEMLRPAAISTDDGNLKNSFFSKVMKPFGFIAGILVGFVGLHKMGLLEGIEGKVMSIFSTLPEFQDVDPQDYEKLRNAVRTPLSAAPQIAIALSKADPLSPIFYLATNLPDGARFEIYVEGIGHRLLNTLSYSGKLDVVTSGNFVRSQPLRYPDGKPIPRGEYVVYVMEAPENQPDLVYKELLQLAPVARNLPKNLPQERRLDLLRNSGRDV
jgi:hypothetical protein